ncbi:MAG: exodeoxyribonuclease VII small subunit [Pseudomonadota bacterium]
MTASAAAVASDTTALTFEQALDELESIVRKLEQGEVPLEESIAMYERGDSLRKRCDELLKVAETKIESIKTGPNGEATGTAPLDVS